MIIIIITHCTSWGEPERAPTSTVSKSFPRELSMYLCMRMSFRKCPRALIHWTVQYFIMGPRPTTTANSILAAWCWSDRTTCQVMATLQEAEHYSCVVLMGQGVSHVRATGMARLAERTKALWEARDAHGHGTVYCTVSDQQQRELRSCILVRHNHQDSMTAAEKATETTIVCWNRTEHSDMREQEHEQP